MTAPTDKSTPAVSNTKVMPVATMPVAEVWMRILTRLSPARNFGDIAPNTASTMTNKKSGALLSANITDLDCASLLIIRRCSGRWRESFPDQTPRAETHQKSRHGSLQGCG